MSKKPTYEERIKEQLEEFPLPDREQSWEKMKQLLKDDDDQGGIVPPALLRTCAGWGLLLVALLTATWLLIRPKKESRLAIQTTTGQRPAPQTTKGQPANKAGQPFRGPVNQPKAVEKEVTEPEERNHQTVMASDRPVEKQIPGKVLPGEEKAKGLEVKGKVADQQKQPTGVSVTGIPKNEINAGPQREGSMISSDLLLTSEANTIVLVPAGIPKQIVSTSGTRADSMERTSSKNQKFWWRLGVGVQQAIPVSGQSATAYTYKGDKNALRDYIPSLYVQLHKGQQWYVQGEFQYGAPQPVAAFSFSQQTQYDAAANTVRTTKVQLKKTYYHQLLASFHYYLRPGWSVGLGGAYSRFRGAVTEEETKITNVLTGAASTASLVKPVQGFKDSFLYKTQVHVLLESAYQWKHFSLGLRYLKDLQPFIKYTKPDGAIETEKNHSLDFFVRCQLWQSGKK